MTGGQGHDDFVVESYSGRDTITDFSNQDTIVFNVPGVNGFGDLTFVSSGSDTLVTWGTLDSLLLQGVKPNQLNAHDFQFGSGAAAAFSFATASDLQNDAAWTHGAGAVHDHLF